MKKYIYLLIVIPVMALQLTSCDKFLDLNPQNDKIIVNNEDSTYFTSAGDVESALQGVYGDLRNEYFELDYFVNGDAQSDDAYAGADNPANFQIDDYNIDALNTNVSRDWGYLYAAIGKANAVINNIEDVTDPELTESRKNEIIGEASFLRAFMYFQLVQLWGDVPLQLQEIKTISAELLPEIYPIMFPARDPKEEVYAQIIKDLEVAVSSAKITAQDKGYVTRGAVNTLLAKVYATVEPHDWNKVLKYCNDVISGGYSLLPEYDQLWDNSIENSSESIFEINYAGTSSSGNWGASMFMGLDWKKFNIPSNDLVKAFNDEGDVIRKNSSITFMDVTGSWTDQHWPQTNYPFAYKYRAYTSPSPQNYIFFRLADVILLKAEALNETGDTPGAAALVNQIRSRVDLPNTTASTQDAMRLAIEKERRLELAFEGHRWFDLKRTGRAIAVLNAVSEFGGVNMSYNLNENRLLWPIPQSELDKNTKLIQNPGY
ncbi:MAG: RagB/SusD family nutrient uptake outer membrane protein [Bacteroidales bacterium]|nr:RagB/SusD family nutrient uptake outer membrane protein [Bacteroidales bacterium]MBK7172050.1 RagB/SusD family nutrient uptake outer membrane protein [Bacteroidales bacterium]